MGQHFEYIMLRYLNYGKTTVGLGLFNITFFTFFTDEALKGPSAKSTKMCTFGKGA